MLLRGRIKSDVSKRLFIASSRVEGRDLRISTLSSLALIFTGVSQITVFVRQTKSGIVVLAVYVDNILLTGGDSAGILETKEYLERHFVTKDMERPKYFVGIEVAHQKYNVLLSQ